MPFGRENQAAFRRLTRPIGARSAVEIRLSRLHVTGRRRRGRVFIRASDGCRRYRHMNSITPGTMEQAQRMTAIIEREGNRFVALCPELDIASEGASIEEARTNLIEALALFFETASSSEVARRLRSEVFVTQVEVPVWVSSEIFRAQRFVRLWNKMGFASDRWRDSHRIMRRNLEAKAASTTRLMATSNEPIRSREDSRGPKFTTSIFRHNVCGDARVIKR